jgi:hypothetical protein
VGEAYGPWLCGQVTIARAAWLAAAGSVPNCWKSGSYPAEAAGSSSSSNSTDGKAGGASSHATTAAAAAGKGGAAAATGESAESNVLEKAAQLLHGVIKTSRIALGLPAVAGCSWDDDAGEVGAAAAGTGTGAKSTSSSGSKGSQSKGSGGKQAKGHGAKGSKGDKHGHGAAAAAAAAAANAAAAGAASEGVDQLLQAQQQQLLVEGLMQLAEVSRHIIHTKTVQKILHSV